MLFRSAIPTFSRYHLFGLGLGAAVIMIMASVLALAYLLLSERVVGPLDRLAGAMGRSQNLEQVPLSGFANDEIGMVARTFNRVSADLAAEQARLSENSLRFYRLISAFRDPIFVVDARGIITYVNPAVYQLVGSAVTTGRAFWSLFHAEDEAIVRQALEQTGEEGGAFEARFLRKGVEDLAEALVSTIRTPSGELEKMIHTRSIRERRAAERMLRTLEHAVSQALDGMALCDAAGTVLYANDAMIKMHGELKVGQNLRVFLSDPELLFSHPAGWSGEVDHLRSDGIPFPTYTTLSPLQDAGGFLLLCRDITVEKRVLLASRVADQRNRQIMESLPIGLVYVEAGGKFVFRNPASYEQLGYTDAEMPSMAEWWELAYPDPAYRAWVAEQMMVAMEGVKATGNPAFPPLQLKVTCKGGIQKVFEVGAILMENGDMLSTFIDLTERLQTLQLLHENLAFVREGERISGTGAWMMNVQERNLTVSPGLRRIIGAPEEEVLTPVSTWDGVHNSHRPMVLEAYGRCIQERAPQSGEVPLRTRDGRDIWIEYRMVPDGTEDSVRTILGAIQDITERKRVQSELESHRRELEEAQTMARVGNWKMSANGERGEWSREAFRLLNLDPDHDVATSANFYGALVAQDREMAMEALRRGLEEGLPLESEVRVPLGDGKYRWVLIKGMATRDADGTPIEVRGTCQDVSVQRQALLAERMMQEKEMADEIGRAHV